MGDEVTRTDIDKLKKQITDEGKLIDQARKDMNGYMRDIWARLTAIEGRLTKLED